MAAKRALISVADKTGIVSFAEGLVAAGYEILSTGGTARIIAEAGVAVTPVEEVTGFPEMMDGRVKTLHPKIHGGILGRRDNDAHLKAMADHGIGPIDLVCVSFYPFEATVAKEGVTREEAIEQIDIGGPSMVRSAAKNHRDVLVVTAPDQYEEVLAAVQGDGDHDGDHAVTDELRARLARTAYARTAAYDAAISTWLEGNDGGEGLPSILIRKHDKVLDLRYGENPHQRAAFYREAARGAEPSVATGTFDTLKKELSYNNLMDLDAALELVKEFPDPAAAVIKHTNPCGCAVGADLKEAFIKAYECDPISAFGCILAVNRELDAATAGEIAAPGKFVEAILAPSITDAAREILRTKPKWKKSLRIVTTGAFGDRRPALLARPMIGGVLVQERDLTALNPSLELGYEVVTDRAPTEQELVDLIFGFTVVKHVKSNAIVLAKDLAAIGVGAGQMSRVESAELAVTRGGDGVPGSVCASDAFFPFPDGLALVAEAGVTAVIQPGGSMRDQDVIDEANRRGVAMVFTRMRHFRH